jgi:hypothetical protein
MTIYFQHNDVFSLGFNKERVSKIPPLCPLPPLLLILIKGARFELLPVEVFQTNISTYTTVSPPAANKHWTLSR